METLFHKAMRHFRRSKFSTVHDELHATHYEGRPSSEVFAIYAKHGWLEHEYLGGLVDMFIPKQPWYKKWFKKGEE